MASSRGGGAGSRGGTKDAQQLRNAAALELGQDMQDDKGEDHPGPHPVQHRHVVAGVETEIERAAADQQPRHRDKENPVHQRDHGTQPRLPAAEQPAQPNLVELDATPEAGAEHIDDVADRHGDQDDSGLHMGDPYAVARQYDIEQVDPGPVGRLRRNAQTGDERNGECRDECPM